MKIYSYQTEFLPLLFSHFMWVRRLYKGYWVKLPRDKSWVAYHQSEMSSFVKESLIEMGFTIEYYGDRK